MLPRIALLLTSMTFALSVWAASRPAVPVIYKTLQLEPFADGIEALGTLRANEAVVLSATVTDTVRAVHFEDSQRVKKGDVLVEILDDEEHALLQQARTAAAEAQRQYERVKSLAATNLATAALLDERRQAYDFAQAQLKATESRLADRVIIAPFDGVVGLRNISAGTLVTPGTPLTTLDDDSVMKLDISIPAVFLNAVQPGLTVVARTRERTGEFAGRVSAIDSRIDPVTRSITVRALINNPERVLRPGMLMTVDLQMAESMSLLLPEEALLQEGYRSFVYRINRNSEPVTVTKHEVKTGPRRPGSIVITAGLNPGDQVVTHGVLRLCDGFPVSLMAEQKGSESLADLLSRFENVRNTP
jgi:membrane fusion protein (multidrug efflux system)